MGQSCSDAVDSASDDKTKISLLKAKHRMLEKLECIKAKLYIGALNDECLPIVCAVDKFHGFIFIQDKEKEEIKKGEKLKSEVENIIKRRLRMSDKGADGELITLVTEVLTTLLFHKQRTYEEQYTHVVYANRNFIRFDYHIHFEILEDGKYAALFYYGQVGLMELARARLPVLMYELIRAMGHEYLKEASQELKELFKVDVSSVEKIAEFLRKRTKAKVVVWVESERIVYPRFQEVAAQLYRIQHDDQVEWRKTEEARTEDSGDHKMAIKEPELVNNRATSEEVIEREIAARRSLQAGQVGFSKPARIEQERS